jgi:SAM-dependent methyltransferase
MHQFGYTLEDVQGVYGGPEGKLWELIMGEQIHIGGLGQSKILAEQAGVKSGEKVLDLCSALGGGVRFLTRMYGVRASGLDGTAYMVDQAKKRTAAEGLDIEYRLGDVTAIPWPDLSFDLVWGEDAWCYVTDKSKLISEASRVLKPGGRIAFSDWVEGPEGIDPGSARRICDFMKFPGLQTQKGYEDLLKANGLKPIVSEDLTPHFAGCVDLYIRMLTEQLTFDALKIINWDMPLFAGMGGEMAFMSRKAHEGRFGRCRIVGVKE